MKKKVLVTGGLGYIGSHTVVELIDQGFEAVIIDNLSNSERFIGDRIEQITGKQPILYESDCCNLAAVQRIFKTHAIDIVIHFAAYKSVNESVSNPLKYFQNNLVSLMNILQAMLDNKVNDIIFSSSATVYGQPTVLPATEQTALQPPLSAYGSTKQMGEEILKKITTASDIRAISLRYFNPVGAHSSSLIGELPKGTPTNLFPFVTQTAIGKLEQLSVFGNDYDTPDGTALRDYIHVVDLAGAHVAASRRLLENKNESPFEIFNIGTGKATSVMEVINAFESITGQKLNYKIAPRRAGDAPVVYADTSKSNRILGWKAKLGLDKMISSAWNWEKSVRK